MNRVWSTGFSLVLVLMLVLGFLPQAQPVYAVSNDVVISQVYGGGGNGSATYQNDFVELFNRGTSTVSVAGWSLQYTSATGTGLFGSNTGLITPLSGSLASGQYMLVQEAAGTSCTGGTPCGVPLPVAADVTDSTPINMAAGGGKLALVNTTTPLGCNGNPTTCTPAALATVVDLLGWDGANYYEGIGPGPTTTVAQSALRASDGCQDTDDNHADFALSSSTTGFAPRNTASAFHYCTGPTNPTGVGAAAPNYLLTGYSTLLTVKVTPGNFPPSTGLAVSCDLNAITGSSTPQPFYDDGTNGDETAGDNTFSFSASVGSDITASSKTLSCTVSDAQARSNTASIRLTVAPAIIPIGQVNGAVSDTEDATAHRSPYAPASGNGTGQTVTVQGVIYEKTLQAIANSTNYYRGFYIQNTIATADGDLNTSDGLFVFVNAFDTMLGGTYIPQVGDEVVITGKIQEYYNMTELSSASLVGTVVRSGVDINAEAAPIVANPPDNLADANRYWERMQGMRVQVPVNSIVLGGRNVFNPADAEVWVVRADSTVARRTDPYTNRAFRDAHPLDDNYNPNDWDGNGYRILMGSLGIKYAAGDAQALIAPLHTFQTVTNAPAGGLNYTFNKYRVEISEQPQVNGKVVVDPAANNPPQVPALSNDYTIADYNLENLYDYRDNPNSKCDFNGGDNPKCSAAGTPFLADVTQSSGLFDYVPASDAAYQARETDIAKEIVNDLHSPDILMVQEVENQDICTVTDGAMDCDGTAYDRPDGKPDVLQELALKIAANGGPAYDAAFDHDSSDLRGIAPAFLYRTDRVQLLDPTGDPVLDGAPAISSYGSVPYDSDTSNPKTLNAPYTGTGACETSWVFPRAPDVGLFRIYAATPGSTAYRDVYVIDNHFKSGPDSCVAHRTEQAKYNAALVAYIEAAKPDARIVVGGDLNVYPRPDDPFAPIGQSGSSDQLGALYNPSLGLKNLWEVLLAQHPEAAYSYVYLGQAQTLDQMFVNGPMLADLGQFHIAHINSDFPADYPGDVARGTSDHDPNVATFGMFNGFFEPVDNPPTVNVVKAGSGVPVKFSLGGDEGLNIFASGYPKSQTFKCDASEPLDPIEQTITAGNSSLQYDPTTDTYTYIWKTDKSWAGSCRQLTVKLVDGTTYLALFKLTK